VAGRDLAADIMGRLTLTELAYLLITHREPTAGERRLLDAVLVSLADHGLTPSALAARLTFTGAPEAVQGAVAAGLLGAGSVFLGPAGDTAQFLSDVLGDAPTATVGHCDSWPSGRAEVSPGGCPGSRSRSPDSPRRRPAHGRLYELAAEDGLLGGHMRLLEVVATCTRS